MRLLTRLALVGLLLVLFILVPTLARWYTDWLWFGELGYQRVFWVPLLSRIGVTIAVGGVVFLLLFANSLFFLRASAAPEVVDMRRSGRVYRSLARRFGRVRLAAAIIGFVALLVGIAASERWAMFQQFVHAVPFGIVDPLFGRDVGFFMFRLPVYQWAASFLFIWLIITLIVVLVGSYLDLAPLLIRGLWNVPLRVRAHVSLLLGLILLVRGWGYWLDAYALVYSASGAARITGAGYTDAIVVLPTLRLMAVLFLVAAILMFANVRLRTLRFAVTVVLLSILASLVGLRVVPGLVQSLRVRPNELTLEAPYIQRGIQGTLAGFGLTRVRERAFPGRAVTVDDVRKNRPTLDNVRLWDYRPLLTAYGQLQTLRQYYTFLDVDIDRYRICAAGRTGGGSSAGCEQRQVMLAARELDITRLATQSRSWVNQHQVFTHGFGLVMSPVNRISEEGMPEFWIRDIPPESIPGLEIREPRIYFGERTDSYVIVNTNVQELDFPQGEQNAYTTYRGRGGIRLSFLRRLAFAYRFADLKLALSSDVGSQSRLLFARSIRARVERIAPFLRYDRDPYLVVTPDGRLQWILDAYTASTRYPYSTPVQQLNYMRNSVKVVIDAYDGTVDFYLVDATDPIARTLAGIFPELFKPSTAVPAGVRAHFRYPVDLFEIQARVYTTFHMRDPRVFYNDEDRWAIPNEIFGSDTVPVEPYYVTMRLSPDPTAAPEFVLILPFVPQSRENLVAWMAARNDGVNYGEILVYRFPKASIVFGPMQVESRINQDAQISQQITLWNQQGSRVIRGNMLVIPIEEGLLYVEPLFLQAETSQLPELKRIIVTSGSRIKMGESFDEALAGVLGGPVPGGPGPSGPAPGTPGAQQPSPADRPAGEARTRLAQEALETYRRAQERLRAGDLKGYAEEIERLGRILEQLAAESR